jgi:hypothetical protein
MGKNAFKIRQLRFHISHLTNAKEERKRRASFRVAYSSHDYYFSL